LLPHILFNQWVGDIRLNWTNYQTEEADRQKKLMQIKSSFGYGGMIHHLKNYVLQKNGHYFNSALHNIEKTKSLPRKFLVNPEHVVKVLVVYDVEFNRKILCQVLKNMDMPIEVDIAENGRIAVEKALQSSFDIIFMDMRMPVMRGEDAVLEIQKRLGRDRPKIVAITASTFEHQKEKLFQIGCHAFISKSFLIDEVVSSIKTLLDVK